MSCEVRSVVEEPNEVPQSKRSVQVAATIHGVDEKHGAHWNDGQGTMSEVVGRNKHMDNVTISELGTMNTGITHDELAAWVLTGDPCFPVPVPLQSLAERIVQVIEIAEGQVRQER